MKYVWTVLTKELKSMTGKQHFWYWVFPTILLGILMFFFFSGVPVLVEIVNPTMNREWGLLENTQLIIVAVMIGVSIYAFYTKKPRLQKYCFALISIFSVFVFLEEIDYGAHFVQYFKGVKESQLSKITGVYNLHNYNDSTAKIFKRTVYVLMLVVFIVAPLLKERLRNKTVSYFIPNAKILILAVLTIIVELIARLVASIRNVDLDKLTMDIGEFSEVMIYYIFLVYLTQLIFQKEWPLTHITNK